GGAQPASAQSLVARESSTAAHSAPAPARRRIVAGERSLYELRLAGRAVGTGSLEVLGEEKVNGHSTMHTTLQVSGGWMFAKVDDRFDSWIDPVDFFSRRFVQDQRELTSRRHRDYVMSPEERTFTQADNGQRSALSSDQPLDDISFLYYARTLPLVVGDVDTIPRYFKPGHDVILKVLRKERVTVPAGTFETIVVQPTIMNVGGLFGQGGQAEVFFSDDAARTIVQIRSKVPIVGSLSLHLKEHRAAK
ncbi:MAG: hypothetical protein JWN79_2149, partial [Gemmatimonadetes bacterium]|nr:hypothetical protein [Gemmatimonadota bacterium]